MKQMTSETASAILIFDSPFSLRRVRTGLHFLEDRNQDSEFLPESRTLSIEMDSLTSAWISGSCSPNMLMVPLIGTPARLH
jgi:hypothetical protein